MAKRFVKCDLCGKKFEKEIRAINWARREGYRIFCSRWCHSSAKNRTDIRRCLACGCEIRVRQSDIQRSKTGRFYCSQSCAAKKNNLGRKLSSKTKAKISRALFGKRRNGKGNSWTTATCLVCRREFKFPSRHRRVVCSVQCGQIYRFGSLPCSKEEAIALIAEIKNKIGDTPSTKIVGRKIHHAILKYFGSWNKAMKELGYQPNTQWMSKKNLKCLDGHRADSISEMIIDNWLYEHGITHERAKVYPGGKSNCDFYLCKLGIWMEYFGLAGQHPEYDKKIFMKREMAKRLGIRLVEIMPYHLYPRIRIGELLE